MSVRTQPARSSRSKLSPERQCELYGALLDEIREQGYEAVTMEAVAARARCGKSTLYRQWRGKAEFVVAALRASRSAFLTGIDTGSLAGDLRAAARQAGCRSGEDTTLVHALAHAALRDEELRTALREALIEPETAAVRAMVDRAVARGEVEAGHPALPFLATQFIGVIRARPVLEGCFADAAYLEEFVEHCLLPPLHLRAPSGGRGTEGPITPRRSGSSTSEGEGSRTATERPADG